MNIREHIRHLKEHPETASFGNKWTAAEEEQLIESIGNGKDINDIAKEHRRTSGGIKSRLRHIAVHMIETDGKSIEEVCTVLRMTHDEIDDVLKRRATANNKNTVVPPKPETELDVLKDIRELLFRIQGMLRKN